MSAKYDDMSSTMSNAMFAKWDVMSFTTSDAMEVKNCYTISWQKILDRNILSLVTEFSVTILLQGLFWHNKIMPVAWFVTKLFCQKTQFYSRECSIINIYITKL